jgi:hypothetical protein
MRARESKTRIPVRRVVTAKSRPERVVERNMALLDYLMRYLLAKPQILGSLPNEFELEFPRLCSRMDAAELQARSVFAMTASGQESEG